MIKLLFLIAALVAPTTEARTVTIDISFGNTVVFDYQTGTYLDNPFEGNASIVFDVDGIRTLGDFGATSIVYYYGANPPLNGAFLSSSISIPNSVAAIAAPYNSYAFHVTQDYNDVFINQFASRTDAIGYEGDRQFSTSLSIYTAWGLEPPRNGDGSSDYFLSEDEILSFLLNGIGKEVAFSQSYSVIENGTYVDGTLWEDSAAVITAVNVSPIPEPSTTAAILLGLVALAFQRKVSKQ
jgi:hypothetical protein